MHMGKDNRGFSMAELVIAMSIIAILSIVSIMGISVVTGAKVNKVYQETVATIERCQMLSLGKEAGEVEAVISRDASGDIWARLYQGGTMLSEENMGNDSIDVSVYFKEDATKYSLSDIVGVSPAMETQGLHVKFHRSTGAFVEDTNKAGGDAKEYVEKIVFSSAGRVKEIRLVGVTGKIAD